MDEKTQAPDFWDDPKKAQLLLKNLKSIQKWVEDYTIVKTALEDLQILMDFYDLGEASEEEIEESASVFLSLLEELEFKNMLKAEEDAFSCMLEINSGAGGTESQDWAQMLMRMYKMWGEKMALKLVKLSL